MNVVALCLALIISLPAFAHRSASSYVQNKLNEGGTWHASGTYELDRAVRFTKPITIIGPVTFKAAKHVIGTKYDLMYAGYMSNITLIDVTIDGNKEERRGAWFCNGTNDAYYGSNIHFDHVDNVVLDGVVTQNAVCGSGMHFSGKNAYIVNSSFLNNGYATRNHWADGLTLLNCDDCLITNNLFQDSTDVSLVFGGGTNTLIQKNVFKQTVPVFAAFAMDNFNNTQSGDFRLSAFVANTIDCGLFCDFGVNIGPHAWYLSRNTQGGKVSINVIRGGKIPILVDGAGTIDQPVGITNNEVYPALPAGSSAQFSCGIRPVYPVMYSPDSVLVPGSQPGVYVSHHLCP